jgi:uncharacterized Tic20 family protein
MSHEQTLSHNVEARLLAALAHGSIVLQGLGMLAGLLVYIHQRDRSRYAAFQALQAAVYQLVTLMGIIGLWVLWSIFYAISFIPLIQQAETTPDAAPPLLFWIGMGSMIIPLIGSLLVMLYGLIGAWAVWRGREFRYPIIGRWLERSGLWKPELAS